LTGERGEDLEVVDDGVFVACGCRAGTSGRLLAGCMEYEVRIGGTGMQRQIDLPSCLYTAHTHRPSCFLHAPR
jgi:hypothetical protein